MNDLDRRLAESLKSVSEALRESRAPRSAEAHAQFRRRLRRRRVTRFASLATATAVVAATAAIAATQGRDLFEGTERGDRSVPAPPAGTYIRVGDEPVGVSVEGGTVWVASSEGTITRVNSATNRSSLVINVGGEPSDIALTEGTVWYSDSADGAIERLSMETPENFVGSPLSLGSQGVHIDVDVGTKGVVWATSPDYGALISIDPQTGEQIRQILVSSPVELAIARGSIWALTDGGSTLIRYDFATQQIALTVPLGEAVKTDMAASADAVYVAEAGGTILRVDAGTGEITSRATAGGTNPELALGNGGLWVTSDLEGVDAELARLDLDDLSQLGNTRTFVGAPTDLAIGDDSVWIADTGRETVVRMKTSRP
jgi:streptogramin lyase